MVRVTTCWRTRLMQVGDHRYLVLADFVVHLSHTQRTPCLAVCCCGWSVAPPASNGGGPLLFLWGCTASCCRCGCAAAIPSKMASMAQFVALPIRHRLQSFNSVASRSIWLCWVWTNLQPCHSSAGRDEEEQPTASGGTVVLLLLPPAAAAAVGEDGCPDEEFGKSFNTFSRAHRTSETPSDPAVPLLGSSSALQRSRPGLEACGRANSRQSSTLTADHRMRDREGAAEGLLPFGPPPPVDGFVDWYTIASV